MVLDPSSVDTYRHQYMLELPQPLRRFAEQFASGAYEDLVDKPRRRREAGERAEPDNEEGTRRREDEDETDRDAQPAWVAHVEGECTPSECSYCEAEREEEAAD
jgi:hypothetical protein